MHRNENCNHRPWKHRFPAREEPDGRRANIIVSERNLPKATALAAELGGKAQTMSIEDAVEKADVIILAIYFQAIKEFVAQHRGALAGKIIVDPSNPIAPDGKGGFKKNHSR